MASGWATPPPPGEERAHGQLAASAAPAIAATLLLLVIVVPLGGSLAPAWLVTLGPAVVWLGVALRVESRRG